MLAPQDVLRRADHRKAPALLERELSELGSSPGSEKSLDDLLPAIDGLLRQVGDERVVPIDIGQLACFVVLGHDRHEGAHHRRVVDHRPRHVAVLDRPHLTHAGLAPHKQVSVPATDPLRPFVHDRFAIARERHALQRRHIDRLTATDTPSRIKAHQCSRRGLNAGERIGLLAGKAERGAIGITGHRHQTRLGHKRQIRRWTRRTEQRVDPDVDDAGTLGDKRTQFKPIAVPLSVEDDVRAPGDVEDGVAIARINTRLAVLPGEVPLMAAVLDAGHRHHLGAEFGQHPAAEVDEAVGNLEHLDAGQQGHASTPSSSSRTISSSPRPAMLPNTCLLCSPSSGARRISHGVSLKR